MRRRPSWRVVARIGIGLMVVATLVVLLVSWRQQVIAPLTCRVGLLPQDAHNGYLQINILEPHATEEMFEGRVFLYYSKDLHPPSLMEIVRGSGGGYAPEVISFELVRFGDGLSTPTDLPISLPTPGVSQRLFPLDSPAFDVDLELRPIIRPGVVIVRNLSSGFLPKCAQLSATWSEKGHLQVKVEFQRNPFVQTTVILMALAAIAFAGLLALVRGIENLTIATASYFFSVWSVRGIVAPEGLPYSSLLDFWLMASSLIALFVVMWRLTAARRPPNERPERTR